MIKTKYTYYPNGKLKTKFQTINNIKQGRYILYFENGLISVDCNYVNDEVDGSWTEYYESGQVAEKGEYKKGEYFVSNFWTESGVHILINGTGKTIRKFGASQGDIFEQYFENGIFKGEKQLEVVIYGKFISKEK